LAVRDSFLVCFLIALSFVIAKVLEDNQTLEAVGIEDGNSVTLIVPNIRPHSDYTNVNLAEVGVSIFLNLYEFTNASAGGTLACEQLAIKRSISTPNQYSSSQTPALPLNQPENHSQVRAYFPFGFIFF